ncbi:MAG: hypothetical protein GXY48_01355 [Methanomicrobiales archaeon]|nr:hypothetical protein [Methanomicrobiales archaeon]
MFRIRILYVIILALFLIPVPICADFLPNATPENQRIAITTLIDVIGFVRTETTFDWTISSDRLQNKVFGPNEKVGSLLYHDSLMTNGGHLTLSGSVDFDSGNKARGAHNFEAEKVYSYESIEGSHLVAEELLEMSTGGNYTESDNIMRCVFSSGSSAAAPAFCNTVRAKSSLVNINSAQVSTKAEARIVAADGSVPSAMSYQIDLTPNPVSGLGYAVGTASTEFSANIMEARDDGANWNQTAATNQMKDKATVSGGIIKFSKAFDYQSGLRLT